MKGDLGIAFAFFIYSGKEGAL
jgi:hypothetical protein